MSQPRTSATAAPPGLPAAAAPGPQVGAAAVPATVPGTAPGQQPATGKAARQDTPRQLRRLTTALILVGLLFGLAAALTFAVVASSLDRAEANTEQLIRVQNIQTNLLSADAAATSAFLVGGLEPAEQRAAYDQAIAGSGRLIAEAAEAQPADAQALSALNQAMVDYAVAIEQARANNRQGFPVGAQYLRNASSTLRSDALPILDNLVVANSNRAGNAMDVSLAPWALAALGLLALAPLVAAMVWVARKFRRRINPGLAAATGLVLLTWVLGLVVLGQVAGRVGNLSDGAFAAVNSAAQARIQANNAKSNESLTLIARGSGASFEQAWSGSAEEVDVQLSRLPAGNLRSSWVAYKGVHQQIRQLDNAGSWDAAVARATGSGAASSNTLFGRFDAAASSLLTSVSEQTATGLARPRALLVVFAILTFLAGLGAALLARNGLAARLKEYR